MHLEAEKNINSDCVGCIVVWTALALAYVFIISYMYKVYQHIINLLSQFNWGAYFNTSSLPPYYDKLTCLRSSTCPLTSLFWLLSNVIFPKLTRKSGSLLVLNKRPNWVQPQPRPQDLGDRGRRLDRTNNVTVTRHMLGNRAINNVGIHLAKVLLLFEFKS